MPAHDPPQQKPSSSEHLAELEAKAVEDATASADESFTPSPSLLNAPDATALMEQVDGPSLADYDGQPSIFVGKSVPIKLRTTLEVPINVTAPGSIVEYSIETQSYDIIFGIAAEREEGITVVKEPLRVDSHLEPISGKFLVGSVPCLLKFTFDNEYSWFREKLLSYKVTVTPPSAKILLSGRRRRAKACHKAVQEDLKSAQERFKKATMQKTALALKLEQLQQELEQQKRQLEVLHKEEEWLKKRVELRTKQKKLLEERLTKGWNDEPAESSNGK